MEVALLTPIRMCSRQRRRTSRTADGTVQWCSRCGKVWRLLMAQQPQFWHLPEGNAIGTSHRQVHSCIQDVEMTPLGTKDVAPVGHKHPPAVRPRGDLGYARTQGTSRYASYTGPRRATVHHLTHEQRNQPRRKQQGTAPGRGRGNGEPTRQDPQCNNVAPGHNALLCAEAQPGSPAATSKKPRSRSSTWRPRRTKSVCSTAALERSV